MPDDEPTDEQSTETGFDLDDISDAVNDALPQEAIEAFKSEAESSGDWEKFARVLYNDNKQQRDRLREVQQENNKLREQGPDDRVVLDEETSAAIQERLPEGTSVDEVPDVLDDFHDLRQQERQRQRRERRQEACEVAGVDPEALGDLEPNAEVAVEEVDGEDESKQVAYIENNDGEKRPLDDYLQEEYPRFESVLFSDPQAEAEGEGETEAESSNNTPNVPTPDDSGGDDATPSSDDLAQEFIARQEWATPDTDE